MTTAPTAHTETARTELAHLQCLHDFLNRLLDRRRTLLGTEDEDQTLVYGVALLGNVLAHRQRRDQLPHQVAIIGPTQVGKSTLVNILLGSLRAEVSGLAGFTRHLQGFCNREISEDLLAATASLLPGFTLLPPHELNPDDPTGYTLQSVPASPFFTTRPCTVWDSPDFDSTASGSYRSLVPMLCAMADLLLLVVSREKYADLAVWQTLRLITAVDKPLLVCVNKTSENEWPELKGWVEKKFHEEKIDFTAITGITFLPRADLEALLSHEDGTTLRNLAADIIEKISQKRDDLPSLITYLQEHWPRWTRELRREHAARTAWHNKVVALIGEGEEIYQRDYLHHPRYRETLQKTVVKLLELLEIPGAAALLVKTRKIITWPVRTLLGLSQKPGEAGGQAHDREAEILEDALSHILVQLGQFAGEQARAEGPEAQWWRRVQQGLEIRSRELEREVKTVLEEYRRRFDPEIEEAAQGLYRHLKEHPATLNSLRAARFSADAAAVALAIKTGGLGPGDLLLAPALLSFTSLLAESSVGRYMKRVEENLKKRQIQLLHELLWKPLERQLLDLALEFTAESSYDSSASELSAKQLEAAQKALAALAGDE